MTKSVRPFVTTGMALITAVALTFVPSAKDAPQSARPAQTASTARFVTAPIQVTAAVQPLQTATLPDLLAEWLDRIVVPPSAGAPFPTPQFPPVIGGTSVSSLIKNTYNAVEPWVQWGFELVAYGVGWVPYVGWLAPQIMIFYNLGERIVRSITFNFADWIGGQVSFAQGLINIGIDTINSFIFFANDQLAFWLPPLPPIPPIGPFATEATTADTMMATFVEETTEAAGPGQIDESIEAVEPGATEEEVVAELATGTEETVVDETAVDETVVDETVVDETVVDETVVDETEPEQSEASKLDANKPTTTSSETVEAQGEVRDTGLNASPDAQADDPSVKTSAEPEKVDEAPIAADPDEDSDENEAESKTE